MASVVGSSYVSQELKSHIGILKDIQERACSNKEQVFL